MIDGGEGVMSIEAIMGEEFKIRVGYRMGRK